MGCASWRRGVYAPCDQAKRSGVNHVNEGGAENRGPNEMGRVRALIGKNFPFIPQNRPDLWFSDVQGAP